MKARFRNDAIEEAFSFHLALVKICGFLGLLALTISCLGLLGMVVFQVENRVKEIGIRKVMGATSQGIAFTLSWDFARLMIIAVPLFVPITYFFFDRVYLRNQYYKIPIGFAEIAASILLLFALGLVTVLSQTLRAAVANPVDALRTE
jgi:ABC-type antimicrobial peptide transport system permease subunit